MRGDILQITNNGVANSVRLVNTPSGHKEEGVNSALFVQDSWRLGRWTLNPGLRYERFVMSIPAQGAGAGTWVPARDFAAQDGIVNWNTVSPRLGFSWDVFGDGRTALKGGVSRYDRLEGVTIIQPLNQLNISFRTCPWSDTNSDKNAQNNEIAFASCSGSLQPTLGNVDPGLKRPHQWEYTAMVQRQIGSNTSVSIGYYGRRFGDLYTTVNAAVPPTAYTPVTITNPVTESADDGLQPGSGHARRGSKRADHAARARAALQRRRVPGEHAAAARDGLRRAHDRKRLRRSGRQRPQQPELPHQQRRGHRIRLDLSDPRRVQLPAAGGRSSSRARSARRPGCRSSASSSSRPRPCPA